MMLHRLRWRSLLGLVVVVAVVALAGAASRAFSSPDSRRSCTSGSGEVEGKKSPLLSTDEEAELDDDQRAEWEVRKDLAACYRLAARFGYVSVADCVAL